jgi:hypothetical protein
LPRSSKWALPLSFPTKNKILYAFLTSLMNDFKNSVDVDVRGSFPATQLHS